MHALNSAKAVKDFRKYLPADRKSPAGLQGHSVLAPLVIAGQVIPVTRPARDVSRKP